MTGNVVLDVIAAAIVWWLLRLEWRTVRWFLTPELLLVRALWHGLAWVAARIGRGRDG